MIYLGDFPADQAIYFMWNTSDSDGASITRSTDGTISVYKDASNGTAFDTTQVTTGVTNDEDFDGLTGMHTCCITTTNAWYEIGHDYSVVLSASTIDTQIVNVVIAHFSIENRHMIGTNSAALAATALTDATWTDAKAAFLDASINAIPTTAMRGTDNAALAVTAVTAADVNAEVVDVLKTDTSVEPTAGAPTVTPTIEAMIKYLYFRMRNKTTTTSTTDTMFNDGGSAIMKATISDDGATFTKEEYVAP